MTVNLRQLASRYSYISSGTGSGWYAVQIDAMDVTTLKRFRQAACTDPVGVQVLGLNRAKEGSTAPRKPKFVPCTNPVPKKFILRN